MKSNGTLLLIHQNPIRLGQDSISVDRKFYDGLMVLLRDVRGTIVSVNPLARSDQFIMDEISVPLSDLPCRVIGLDVDDAGRPTSEAEVVLSKEVRNAKVVYGQSFGAAEMAKRHDVPYLAVVEYDLQTQLIATTSGVSNPFRQAVRAARVLFDYAAKQRKYLREASGVHCNGYPIWEVASKLNPETLLYLDSRVHDATIIENNCLDDRLAHRSQRPLRLLFSGRFERMKGALDTIAVANACVELGLPIEFHAYGQGSERDAMRRLAADSCDPTAIRIHDPISFGELFEKAKTFDIFLCCHNQADPSCSYLEAFGAGLPVIGYGNKMLRSLAKASSGAIYTRVGDPRAVATQLKELSSTPGKIEDLTYNAVRFARAHSFENEFNKRANGINHLLASAANTADSVTPTRVVSHVE